MSDNAIRQHKSLASGGELTTVEPIKTPFAQVRGSDIARGTLLDSQRGATKSGKVDHGSDKS